MKGFIRLNILGFKVALAGRMAYRTDFFFSLFIMLAVELVAPLVTFLIYGAGVSFPGWGLYEALMIQGIFLLAKGVSFPFFFGIVSNTINSVRDGTFDLLMIKPRSTLFMALVTGFDTDDLGKLVSGIAISGIAMSHLGMPGPWAWAAFLLLLVFAMVSLFGFAVFMAATGIVWVGNSRVYEIFQAVTAFGTYPLSIFSKPFQFIISFIIPVAMIGFFPASALLSRPAAESLGACLASAVFCTLSLFYWKRALSHYTSAGG
jgi:ABC-2 type transport system permease protein